MWILKVPANTAQPGTWLTYICSFKSIPASSLIHPHLPSGNQLPCEQNETVKLQTNLMNNPVELLFKLDSQSQMHVGESEFVLRSSEDSCSELLPDQSQDLAREQPSRPGTAGFPLLPVYSWMSQAQ